MRAMILAAGRGQRMGALTEKMPKPLLHFRGKPLLAYAIEACIQARYERLVINVSYLADQITAFIEAQAYAIPIDISYEPEVLETAGGIVQALPYLGEAPFVVISADVVTAYPLAQLQLPEGSLAHLVMVSNPSYHPWGDFILRDGQLSLVGEGALTFGNMACYHPDLFRGITPGTHLSLAPVLKAAIAQGRVSGEYYAGAWCNCGTADQLI